MYDQYWNQDKSQREIGKECGVDHKTILRWMRKFNITARTNSESNKGRKRKPFTKETKKNMSKSKLGDKNGMWKGDEAGYFAIHTWVNRHKPKVEVCELCDKKYDKLGKKKLELSCINHQYKRDIDNFQWAHHSCHMSYDYERGFR